MPNTLTASAFITDALDRAKKAFEAMLDPDEPKAEQRYAQMCWMHHITTVILLENLRRENPALADQLTEWALSAEGIFTDGYPAELAHGWQEQIAAGRPMDPIRPDAAEVAR